MSQSVWASINPTQTSGLMLAALLDDFKAALMSGLAGTSRPANLQAGGMWVDTTNQNAPSYYWAWKFYTGTEDVEVFRISILNGIGGTLTADGSFTTQTISADAVGSLLEIVKNRIANNGQVLSGDAVAEIRMVGRTITGTNPTLAFIRFTSTDNMATAEYGGTMSFTSTPEGTASIVEHFKFINGLFELVAPHNINSLQQVSQNIATTPSIAQLSAAKVVAEMTGATATEIQGINSGHDSKVIYIHNRSTANITLKHQHASAAAADRMSLPNATDFVLLPESTVGLYYCTADTRWKVRTAVGKKLSRTLEEIKNLVTTDWTAPAGVTKIRVCTHRDEEYTSGLSSILDTHGNLFEWGSGGNGGNGDGTSLNRSSPVAVIGGLKFIKYSQQTQAATFAISDQGKMYSWGANLDGMLGVGNTVFRSSPVAVLGEVRWSHIAQADSWAANTELALDEEGRAYVWGFNSGFIGLSDAIPRSSPVAVEGGIKFAKIYNFENSTFFGIDRTGDAYAWGANSFGQLGVGDTTSRSTPTLVVGGFKWQKLVYGGQSGASVIGLDENGIAYGWGNNASGKLGVGDTTQRESPVQVLGGLTFKDIIGSTLSLSFFGLTDSGELYGWGDNLNGQLGVGDITARSSPVQVIGGLTFKKAFTHNLSSYGIDSNDGLYAWGSNNDGQLGVGNTTNRSSPVQVLGSLKWRHINTGLNEVGSGDISIGGITTDGVKYSWGREASFGTLGVGDLTPRSSPVAVVGFHACGLDAHMETFELEVVPGNSYTIVLSQAKSNFGEYFIGYGVDRITIEYDK